MSDVKNLFSVEKVTAEVDERVGLIEEMNQQDASNVHRFREDRVVSVREAFNNAYFKTLVDELKDSRKQLRSKLSSTSGESIGRYQAVAEFLDRIEADRVKYLTRRDMP